MYVQENCQLILLLLLQLAYSCKNILLGVGSLHGYRISGQRDALVNDVITNTCLLFVLCAGHIEPIPVVLQAVIDHLVLWRLIPESRKPNSVIINFFDEVGAVVLLPVGV